MKSVNGWKIVYITSTVQKGQVQFESMDARLNGMWFDAINSLAMAQPGWTYVVRFRDGKIVDDRILQEG